MGYYYIYPDCPNNPEAYKLEKPHECETGVDYTPIDSRDCFCDRLDFEKIVAMMLWMFVLIFSLKTGRN